MQPVLMYHGIHDSERDDGVFNPVYSVTTDAFRRQLDRLADLGFTTVRLDEHREETHPVVLTFDDGDVSNLEVALPLLQERGMVAEFFVTSGFVGRPGMLTPLGVRELAEAGMRIQSHGRTHEPLADLDDAVLEGELSGSRDALESWSGTRPDALSLPGGRGGARELRIAERLGYRHVLNSVPGPNRRRRPGHYLHRIAVTRSTALHEFDALIRWRGVGPRRALVRTAALELPKRLLGNARYDELRTRLLPS